MQRFHGTVRCQQSHKHARAISQGPDRLAACTVLAPTVLASTAIAPTVNLKTVVPAQAGTQFCRAACSCSTNLDSRLRGNDGF
ncbi:hypothetical protein BN2497_10187 [Janthinobacterium sp. CG23_2]|nr:hypothetical protein BN2497_10187 [Janthinobacterium sp. CG23_2]CUU31491.1 hypothetical protein BN3177_10187 [Janthinobacterium sp. CG23_2]